MHSYAYSSCLRQYLDVNLKNDEKPVAMRDGCAYRGSRLTGGLPLHQSQHSSFEAIMPFYPAETISEFAKMHSTWKDRHDDLATKIMARYYRNKRASEYARHGLSRRLQCLLHSIDQTFSAIPPDSDEQPSRNELMDATAFLHSFLVNVYGAIDNLAWIWCLEGNITQDNGTAVPDGHVGLGPKNKTVRSSLSPKFQAYLATSNDWFDYLENKRHALAHRIQIYIPPKTLREEDGAEWQRLEAEITVAMKNGDLDVYDDLFTQQASLGAFQPVMTHSFGDKAKPVLFHGQMLCDFATVIEIGEYLVEQLGTLDEH